VVDIIERAQQRLKREQSMSRLAMKKQKTAQSYFSKNPGGFIKSDSNVETMDMLSDNIDN
jgi:hypothetical protein